MHTFNIGSHLTKRGFPAFVAQVRSTSRSSWKLKGAVRFGNVYYLATWAPDGANSNHPDYDLVHPEGTA